MSSKRHCRETYYDPMLMGMGGYGGGYGGCSYGGLGSACGFNFSYILILILIALQFGYRRVAMPPINPGCADGVVTDPGAGAAGYGGFGGLGGFGGGFGGFGNNGGLIDNSILFILAFYLLVCGCCIGGGGGGRGCGCGGGFGGFGGRW